MENMIDTIDALIPPPSELRARCLREITLARESAQAALQHARNARWAYLTLSCDFHDMRGLDWIGDAAIRSLVRACAELPQGFPTIGAEPATATLTLCGDCACG